ncbi:MAG: YggS family pyridoxal phosphate-dependent enzyme, partial [Candidatus Limnocylindrales bacterium]
MGSPPDFDTVARFGAARSRVLADVAEACRRVGRDPDDVALVAVSKTVAVERLGAAVAAGLTLLGENRVQEAESKAPLLMGARWHLI